jgi:tetratricopeptide (TPR) repeat protein
MFGWRRGEVWYRLHRGKVAVEQRDADGAVERLVPVLTLAPENAEAHFWLARAYRRQGDMTQVRAHLERARTLGFSRDRLRREEWLAMAQSGQIREATPHLSELLIDPGDDGPDICEAYVNGFFLTCRFRDGLALLDVWRAEFPNDAQPYLFRARYNSSVGDLNGATDDCRTGLVLDPERRDLKLLLAAALLELHELDQAEELLRNMLAAAPDDIDVLQRLSECLFEQGRHEQADAALARLLARDPDNVRGRLTRARSQTFSGHGREAVALAQAVVDERPFDVEAHFVLGMALQTNGQADDAARHFAFVETARTRLQEARLLKEKISTKDPGDATARYEVGCILLKYDSPEEGAGWLHSALDLDPGHQPSHAALAEYYAGRGNRQLAEQHRRQLVPDNRTGAGGNSE